MWILWTPLWINNQRTSLSGASLPDPSTKTRLVFKKRRDGDVIRSFIAKTCQEGIKGVAWNKLKKKDRSIFSSALLQSCPQAEHHIRVEGDITLPSGLHCEAWVTVLESSTLCFLANAFLRQTPSGELITRKWKWPANAHQSGIIRICDSPSAPPCLRTVPRRTAKINFCTFQRQQTK